MYWVNFLHIYQPFDQSKEILERVVNESYRPLFKGLLDINKIKINLNINGALAELLVKKGYHDVIDIIETLAEQKKLEFTESAKYHALLPFLDKNEIIRQIQKNYQINKKYFGRIYKPVCFFPPEMAYNKKIAAIISRLGYKIIILDEIAYNGGESYPSYNKLFFVKNAKPLIAVFRERMVSNSIMSAVVKNKKEFLNLIRDEFKENRYLLTAMDGETFGHHRPGLEKTLFKILSLPRPKQIFFSELPNYFEVKEETSPISSTWASTKEDIDKGIQFYSWKDPKNKIHKLQWTFLNYLLVIAKKRKLSPKIEERIDRALASDQFFWASGEPWWSIEMIERGAWTTFQTLKNLPKIKKEEVKIGEKYYKNILAQALQWQRNGKIEEKAKKYKEITRIPFKERTLGANKPEEYYAFLELMEKKMWESTKKKNFERAILWRDAIWKLETKNDIYDAIHVVNLLRTEVPDSKIREVIEKYKKKYNQMKPGQPEMRKI